MGIVVLTPPLRMSPTMPDRPGGLMVRRQFSALKIAGSNPVWVALEFLPLSSLSSLASCPLASTRLSAVTLCFGAEARTACLGRRLVQHGRYGCFWGYSIAPAGLCRRYYHRGLRGSCTAIGMDDGGGRWNLRNMCVPVNVTWLRDSYGVTRPSTAPGILSPRLFGRWGTCPPTPPPMPIGPLLGFP